MSKIKIKFGGEYRKQIYDMLENLKLNKKQHSELRQCLKEYVNAKTEQLQNRLKAANHEIDRLKKALSRRK